MKYSIVLKFIAIVLCAVSLVGMVAAGCGVVLMASEDLLNRDIKLEQATNENSILQRIADELGQQYAAVHWGNCPEDLLSSYYNSDWQHYLYSDLWYYQIQNSYGADLEKTYPSDGSLSAAYQKQTFRVDTTYLKAIGTPRSATEEHYPMGYGGTVIYPGEEDDNLFVVYWDSELDRYMECQVRKVELTNLTVTLWVREGAFRNQAEWMIMAFLAELGYWIYGIFLAFLLIFAAGAVYLCFAAGRNPRNEEIAPGGLNLIPLDLYATAVFFGELLALVLIAESFNSNFNIGMGGLMCLIALAAGLLLVGFCFAVVAQVKTKGGYWWRHCICGWVLVKIGHGLRWCLRGLCRLLSLMPLIWRWLAVAALMAIFYGFAVYAMHYNGDGSFFLLLAIAACAAVVCYGAYAYGTLAEGVKKMAEGDLHHKIPTRFLVGSFREAAEELNHLADVAVVAAKNQMKSERMKTELITNVSHDIKTPLTSIINFVDLLQKPHTEEEGVEYLEVLSRQSQRLKRLIEDLMDLSKADTGNMTVNITELDAVEVVQQALGEFADKLTAANLVPIFQVPEKPVRILADGRLTWRVLSNLLSNAVKYALPGTRVYVDVVELEDRAVISLKNISADQLNTDAEELMERFVRGDTSRNREGSGLGLNIARSLMEVQHGKLQLLVDGDLFKVTLIFPKM